MISHEKTESRSAKAHGVLLCFSALLLLSCSTFAESSNSFRTIYTASTGLGSAYNGASCADCHNAPLLGGSSQITVTRAGHRDISGLFIPIPNGGVLHKHFVDPGHHDDLVAENIHGQRVAINVLGDGYIEAIEDRTLLQIAAEQRRATGGKIDGQVVYAPVLEAPGKIAVGRFGWKSQHASLLSSLADALRAELGIGSRLYPLRENGSNEHFGGRKSAADELAVFIRETEPPPREEMSVASISVHAGSEIFDNIGCGTCHIRTFVTAPAGTTIDGGRYTIPKRLGAKTIHPYSDLLLHNVGTGDGIVQSAEPKYADQSTANKFRTAPLWGVRFRTWMMHDGKAVTYHQAIMRHAGEATGVINKYQRLSPQEKHQLREFLNSL